MNKRVISLLLAFVLTAIFIPFEFLNIKAYAISQSDFTDWFKVYTPIEAQMVANTLGVPASVGENYINKHFLNQGNNSKLVYGSPYGWKEEHGYRYLGYNQSGNSFTNQDFKPDAGGNFNPKDRDWVLKPWGTPHDALIRNQGLPIPENNWLSSTPTWMRDAAWTNEQGQTFRFIDFGLPINELHLYATVIQEPGIYSEGAIRLYHYRSGQYWYITLLAPPKQSPKLPDPIINIKAKSSQSGESENITVKEGESYEIVDRSKSGVNGSVILRWQVKKEKKVGSSWTVIDNKTLSIAVGGTAPVSFFRNYNDPVGEYRYTITEIEDILGPISKSPKTVYVTVTKDGSGSTKPDPEPPSGSIQAVLDGPSVAEWGDTIYLDSSRSTSTSTIVKREYWRRTSMQKDWVKQSQWDNEVKPKEKTIESGNAEYIEYKLKITDSKGNTSEDINKTMMTKAVKPEVHADLRFITDGNPVKISLEDYLSNKEMTVNYWVDASSTSWLGTSLGVFYFFQNTDDSTIRKYENDERNARNDANFIQNGDNPVRINTRDNPDSIRDAAAWGKFKFTPQNPQIKAAVMVRSSNVAGPYSFATSYHTVEFEIDSIPPTTQLSIPSIFYPKEINNLEHKTITWSYSSEQNIPYRHSIVSLYKKTQDGYYEEVFRNRIMNERKLVVEGDAHEEYEIYVKVVDELGKESERVEGEFTIIGAVPVIDLELDNKTIPDILKIQVFNKTPEEIESLFPTSYTTWKIEDINGNMIVEGDGEAPKTVDLDTRFDRGKYTVTQNVVNTLGVTAQASKDFEITSSLNFVAEPYVQFEDDFIELIDLSKHITDQKWEIRENNEIEFSNLYLNENNAFTRDEGVYQIKLRGVGYFEYVGEVERQITKIITFLSTKPKAAFVTSGNLKMYKEIILDGSISKQVTEARLQAKYPIDFSHEKTVFEIIPIKDKAGKGDPSRLEYILGNDKEVLEDRVIFKGKQLLSIRIDKEGWYKARYKVYNHRKESDWYEEEFYVAPKLSPRANINVEAPVVFRDPDNELKVKMEVIVDYESLDEEIDFDKSTLFLAYSPNREEPLQQTYSMYIQKNTRSLGNLVHNFSDIFIDWREKRAVFTIILDDPKKNLFGRFIFDFLAIEKEKIPNYTEVGDIPDKLSKADTSHVNAELKTILIDNNKPYIEIETTKTNTVEIWIIEESDRPLNINKIIKDLELNRIKAKIYLIKEDKTVEIFE